MIPNVFVSSTIADLHHLRDAIRDTVTELGYFPVMSEYGDIGYLPTATAEDSCYLMVEQCQLAVIVVSKRYGSRGRNDLSITQNEFRTARDRGIPVIALVDSEVLAFKKIYEMPNNRPNFAAPGMDAPAATFEFLDDVTSSSVNNGILGFSTVAEARHHLKRQLAHIFGDLLRNRFDSVRGELKDILSELKTLRHEFRPAGAVPDERFLRAVRFLVDDSRGAHFYRQILSLLRKPVDVAAPMMLAAATFDDLVVALTTLPPRLIGESVEQWVDVRKESKALGVSHWRRFIIPTSDASDRPRYAFVGVTNEHEVLVNQPALEYLRAVHQKFLKKLDDSGAEGDAA